MGNCTSGNLETGKWKVSREVVVEKWKKWKSGKLVEESRYGSGTKR
jgi:hypothetical protein